MWIKNGSETTIEEVITRNTGMSYRELNSCKVYKIDGLQEAAGIIASAINAKKKILIAGDYDADGITSSSIMHLLFEHYGVEHKVRIPRRFSEGYGLSAKIVDESDADVLITVDNGIVAFDAVKLAKDKGMTVIVTDHHLPLRDEDTGNVIFPEADVVVDPHCYDGVEFEDWCGAGLALRLSEAVFRILGHDMGTKKVVDKMTSFAAIGTVADVMPLVKDNRKIVKDGLRTMKTVDGRTKGLYQMLKLMDIDKTVQEGDIGFKIGPTLNASGRLYDNGAEIAFNALVYDEEMSEAATFAQCLIDTNTERKELVKRCMEQAENQIANECLFAENPLFLHSSDYPEGIVGIIAGRLVETYKVPVFVFTDSEEAGIYKGSARSHGGVHLKNLLDECSDLLYRYGGHAEAAGVSVEASKFDKFIDRAQSIVSGMKFEETSCDDIYYDLEIDASEVQDTLKELQKYAPFGTGNPEVVFKVNNISLSPSAYGFFRTMGENNEHLKLFGNGFSMVGFNMTEKYQNIGEPKTVSAIGSLSYNYYMEKANAQVTLQDFEKIETKRRTALAAKLAARATANSYK